jgi:hypothetical protein
LRATDRPGRGSTTRRTGNGHPTAHCSTAFEVASREPLSITTISASIGAAFAKEAAIESRDSAMACARFRVAIITDSFIKLTDVSSYFTNLIGATQAAQGLSKKVLNSTLQYEKNQIFYKY